jgi:drug/metabolite transporter, DME family
VRLLSSESAVIATAEPVVAAILAYLFWDETLGVVGSFGAALVITGVIVQAVRR